MMDDKRRKTSAYRAAIARAAPATRARHRQRRGLLAMMAARAAL